MSVPEWKQQDAEKTLGVNLYPILEEVMGYVDEGWTIQIDSCAIEQELEDIRSSIEELAMKIENGEYHKDQER